MRNGEVTNYDFFEEEWKGYLAIALELEIKNFQFLTSVTVFISASFF